MEKVSDFMEMCAISYAQVEKRWGIRYQYEKQVLGKVLTYTFG